MVTSPCAIIQDKLFTLLNSHATLVLSARDPSRCRAGPPGRRGNQSNSEAGEANMPNGEAGILPGARYVLPLFVIAEQGEDWIGGKRRYCVTRWDRLTQMDR